MKVVHDERGVAMVASMLLVMVLSLMASSLMFVARTETLSSANYKHMSQGRYGAESAIHRAANYLLYTYAPPSPIDPAIFDTTVSPVRFNGAPVVLASDLANANYPDAGVAAAFSAASQGNLAVGEGTVRYTATARLLSMRQIMNAYGIAPTTLQTWEITGTGSTDGSGSAVIEVSAVIDRQVVPAYNYAAFATHDGCDALSFAGGAITDSYDSRTFTPPMSAEDFAPYGGDVGTNGNLDGNGGPTTINGNLSTPRSGVGACTAANVTAATISGFATVEGSLVELPQPVTMPTPAAPNPLPPTTNSHFNGAACPANTAAYCTATATGGRLQPAAPGGTVVLGNIRLNGGVTVELEAGTYIVNSLELQGNSTLIVNSGPVIFKVVGDGVARPIDFTGGGIVNDSYDPSDLQFVYAGTGEVRLRGGAEAAAVVYAPNASTSLAGGSDFYGSIVTRFLTATGGAAIHYDRALGNSNLLTPGQFTMTSFTWRAF